MTEPQFNRIKSITIEGFRSLKNIQNLELSPLTVLIGANGAGKSTLIRFFEMLSWILKGNSLPEFILRHGGGDDQFFLGARKTPVIKSEISLEFGDEIIRYSLELGHLPAGDSMFITKESWNKSSKIFPLQAAITLYSAPSQESSIRTAGGEVSRSILQLLGQCTSYHFHDTSENASIRLRQDITDSARLRSDGGNLAAVLLNQRENDFKRYQLIVRQIQRVLPIFKDFVLEPVYGKVDLRWIGRHSEKTFGAHLTSDGSLRLFCLLTLLNLPSDQLPQIMFFDEPELGLHPHAISLIAEMLKRLSKKRQIFIATQSPYLVDCFELENIIVASANHGETMLRHLPREQHQAWLDDEYQLSDIWLKQAVGGME